MTRSHHQILLAILVLILFIVAQNAVAAKYFVYQLPDGSRVITDRPKHKATHQFIASKRKTRGIGRVAAKRHQKIPEVLSKWDSLIKKVSSRHNVDAALVKAVIHTESYFRANATSRVGASGLMQLMPQTAEKYGVRNIYDPYENLDAGVRHLRYLLGKYPDSLNLALAAYNAGETAVYYYNGVPPYPETRNYVRKVIQYHDFYSKTH